MRNVEQLSCTFNNKISNLSAHQLNISISIRSCSDHTNLEEIASFVEEEMFGVGSLEGYRWFHLQDIQRHFLVSQETVRLVIKYWQRVVFLTI